MGIIARQTIKTSAVYYVAAMVGVINRLFLLPDYLTPTELGFIDIFIYFISIFSSIATLGSYAMLYKYHQYYKNKNQYPALIGKSVLMTTVGFIFLSFLFFIFKETIFHAYENDLELLKKFYHLIPLFALVVIIKNLFSTYSVISLRLTVPTIFNELWVKLTTLVLLILISLKLISFYDYIHLLLFSYVLATIIIAGYCIKILKFKINFKVTNFTKKENTDTLKYSSFVLLSGLTGFITLYADTLMLGSYEGFDTSAIYSVAFFIGMSIELPKRALSTISQPIIASHFENNNMKEINKLYKQSSINQGFIGFLFFLLIFINLDSIFSLIPKDIYSLGKNVALFIGVSKLIDMFLGVNSEILRASKHYYLDLYFLVFFVIITVGLNLIFIPLYQINGAAVATLVSVFIYNLVRFVILKKIYGFYPFTFQSIKLLVVFGALAVIGFYFPSFSNELKIFALINIAIKGFIFTLSFLILSYKLNISPEINKLINLGLNRIGVLKN